MTDYLVWATILAIAGMLAWAILDMVMTIIGGHISRLPTMPVPRHKMGSKRDGSP